MKKRRQAGVLFLTAAVLAAMTACGGSREEETDKGAAQDTQQAVTVETQTVPAPETDETPDTETLEENGDASDQPVESAEPAEPVPFVPVEGLSETYADLENLSFAYDGQIYTLGKSTLQDMIDGGVPFDPNELNNANNNVNSNYETDRYTVEINDYVMLQVSFLNVSDSNISQSQCPLHLVRWYSIYVPQPDYEDSLNQEITEKIADAAQHVCFAFPLTLTRQQLLENSSGGVEEEGASNSVKYQVESEVYMGESGYTFQFNKTTDQLKDVSVSWLP